MPHQMLDLPSIILLPVATGRPRADDGGGSG